MFEEQLLEEAIYLILTNLVKSILSTIGWFSNIIQAQEHGYICVSHHQLLFEVMTRLAQLYWIIYICICFFDDLQTFLCQRDSNIFCRSFRSASLSIFWNVFHFIEPQGNFGNECEYFQLVIDKTRKIIVLTSRLEKKKIIKKNKEKKNIRNNEDSK